ncbi:MAG: DUF1566 domain-containing protein [Deltaproteobacteria bacterium]|nr:DUF1566 domain-containing protein [Deltaproteobacteria bacterium]
MRRQILTALCAVVWAAVAQAGPTAEQKCQQAKWKAQAKLEACLKKNHAKLAGGGDDAAMACWTKFAAGLVKADAKAAAAGAACRFADNGDGTVSDLDTGLTWQQTTNADGAANPADPRDADNVYALSASGTAADGTAYTAFLAALNDGESTDGSAATAISGCFAGHCDWRLPSIVELQAIAVPAQCGVTGCFDPRFGPRLAYSFYWSASGASGDPSRAWDMRFGGSNAIYTWPKINTNSVQAVRGGLSSAAPAGVIATPTGTVPAPATATPTPSATVAPPTQTPGGGSAAAGAPCAANNQCASGICGVFGSGRCCAAACSASGICGATDCNAAGACVYPSTATIAGAVAGDCQKLTCNGAGGTMSVDDPSDPPVSSSACLTNPTCSGSPLAPQFTAAPAGTDCTADNAPPTRVCGSGLAAGACVECNTNADCSGAETCSNGMCL